MMRSWRKWFRKAVRARKKAAIEGCSPKPRRDLSPLRQPDKFPKLPVFDGRTARLNNVRN